VSFSAFVVIKPRTDVIAALVGSHGLGLPWRSCRGKKNPVERKKNLLEKRTTRASRL